MGLSWSHVSCSDPAQSIMGSAAVPVSGPSGLHLKCGGCAFRVVLQHTGCQAVGACHGTGLPLASGTEAQELTCSREAAEGVGGKAAILLAQQQTAATVGHGKGKLAAVWQVYDRFALLPDQ